MFNPGCQRPFTALFGCAALLMLGIAWTAGAGAQNDTAAMPLDCDPDALDPPLDRICEVARRQEGHRLFSSETFGGNGRTCETCHAEETGTFSPDDALVRFLLNPDDPLFRHDGLDDGVSGVTRILEHATVRVTLPLPDYVTLKDDPGATHVTFLRGTPTVKNVPAFDDRFMVDLRHQALQEQALGAVHSHTQNTIEPTPLELDLIAEFQRSSGRFFSSGALRKFAQGDPPPVLPAGTTASEQRGRLFFVDAPFSPPDKAGVCALCHSGPNLDAANVFSSPVFGNPPGVKEFSIGVSERNVLGNPTYTFLIHDSLGEPVEVTTPDLGMLMTDWDRLLDLGAVVDDPVLAFLGIRRGFFANFFKTPTLWGVRATAPYFHDNSAKNLDELLEQYDWFFENSFGIAGQIELTEQDKADIKAYLDLL